MWGCVYRKEPLRIRTATNFLGRSGGPSEDVFCSSVTNVADLRVLQTSHSPLNIPGKTLSLSITTEKYTVVPWQHSVTSVVDLTSCHDSFLNFWKGPWCCWGRNSAILVRNEITSMALYHIWKILYQQEFANMVQTFVWYFWLLSHQWPPLQKHWKVQTLRVGWNFRTEFPATKN